MAIGRNRLFRSKITKNECENAIEYLANYQELLTQNIEYQSLR